MNSMGACLLTANKALRLACNLQSLAPAELPIGLTDELAGDVSRQKPWQAFLRTNELMVTPLAEFGPMSCAVNRATGLRSMMTIYIGLRGVATNTCGPMSMRGSVRQPWRQSYGRSWR